MVEKKQRTNKITDDFGDVEAHCFFVPCKPEDDRQREREREWQFEGG